jgi:G:T/U-mismatch repair DNA glycosylase
MRELHPYGEFIPKNARSMIIGSFPIGKFSDPKRRHEIKGHEFDFFFGGEKNLLWKLLGAVFNMPVQSRSQVKKLLTSQGLGIGDVIKSCKRKSGGGSDTDLYDIEWNNKLIDVIRKNRIGTLYFTSKKVETWFNRLFKDSDDICKILLISPSGQSIRSITRRDDFKKWERTHKGSPKVDFILHDYRLKFNPKA